MKTGKKNLWIMLVVLPILVIIASQVVRHFYKEKEQQARTSIRETIKKNFPIEAKRFMATYGLRSFHPSKPSVKLEKPAREVILIHGLDDPGKVWMNLAPALDNEGFSVWIMTYPNDQPITESAHFLLKHLALHNASEKKNISIVAHSMGGLVVREMLTDSVLSYAEKAKKGELPQIEKFIMVGTPNNGSELARFRIFTEVRDQLTNLFDEDYHWLQGIFDGAGEAGIDLIPGSRFLKNLNSRAHPDNVNMMVIAGVMSPAQKSQLEAFTLDLENKLQGDAQSVVKTMMKLLNSASNNVGDGFVPVDSARLPGVPFKVIQGTHLSIIRNIRIDSQRMPPAIPIIVDHL